MTHSISIYSNLQNGTKTDNYQQNKQLKLKEKEMSRRQNQSQERTKEQTQSRDRKRASRSNESCVTNSLVLMFITQANATVTFRKSKKSKATIKMYLPENINLNGTLYDQITLCKYNDLFMRNFMLEDPVDIRTMDDKQYNRSKEAQINNGLLYLLNRLGFSFTTKQTRKTKSTEKLVKISSLTTPTKYIFDSLTLETMGLEFSKVIEEMFGREMMINVTKENIPMERFPQLPIEETSFSMTDIQDNRSGNTSATYQSNGNVMEGMYQNENGGYQPMLSFGSQQFVPRYFCDQNNCVYVQVNPMTFIPNESFH